MYLYLDYILYIFHQCQLKQIINHYNIIFKKHLTQNTININVDINQGIYLKFIIDKIFRYYEREDKDNIINYGEIIANIIRFSWKYNYSDELNLLIELNQYKIFLNENNELKYLNEVNHKVDLGINNPEMENELLELTQSKFININFKEKFLSSTFENILYEYHDKFSALELNKICRKEIDDKISDFYYRIKNENLMEPEYNDFRISFFKLNKIVNKYKELKDKFPKFMRNKGFICLQFLECDGDEMGNFIEDVERVVNFKLIE